MELRILESGTVEKAYINSASELEVFKLAYAVSLKIHQASLTYPKIEQYSLADQLRRSSKSICANLTEGFSRQTQSKTEFKRFITIALGSAHEVQLWLKYSVDLKYIDRSTFEKWDSQYLRIAKMLVNLRNKS
jgi:four helix bundle protein